MARYTPHARNIGDTPGAIRPADPNRYIDVPGYLGAAEGEAKKMSPLKTLAIVGGAVFLADKLFFSKKKRK
jgi:hypothetical protein